MAWHWDQGRLPYFQFDSIRQIAGFVVNNDFKTASREALMAATGLPFSAPKNYAPWRNYSRVLKLSLLVSEVEGKAVPTPVAHILSRPGIVTCDEYLHFLLQTFTEPSPALTGWNPNSSFRYPLLFALKYLLAKAAIGETGATTLHEIVGAYVASDYTGAENNLKFISIVRNRASFEKVGLNVDERLQRQARESLLVMAQISYLYVRQRRIQVSLNQEDALEIFESLSPTIGRRATDCEAEIRRLASFFKEGSTLDSLDYPNTTISEVVESGFREGSKVKKTHVIIERNATLRREYFASHTGSVCNVCMLDTKKTYPWTERVLDLHHLLPLASGTRVEAKGTTFEDIVPVCPSCHRAIHRFYDTWLSGRGIADFRDAKEAVLVYDEMKSVFPGLIC